MSINALTNAAVARRPDFQPVDAVPTTLAEIADAAASVPMPVALASGARPAKLARCRACHPGQRSQHGLANTHDLYPDRDIDPVCERDRRARSIDDNCRHA
jgi:hypothetical protein